ncbi:MAG: ImmA/IrrE family metallo-endopeptidase [Actinobacteria bacterium]|nr:ImmA/IrrE family metallo-endopeptidase [Actinomycetota bacterium]
MDVYSALLELAKRREIMVIDDASFPRSIRGFYSRMGDKHMIVLNKSLSSKIGPLILAHELGHYQLHRHKIAMDLYAHKDKYDFIEDEKYERQADAFAKRLVSFVSIA